MADRDAARIKLKFPDMDYDPSGVVDSATAFYCFIFEGPSWSGFDKPATMTTTTADALDGWGNIVQTYRGGTVIDYGTLTMGVDWDIDNTNGGDEYHTERDPNQNSRKRIWRICLQRGFRPQQFR